MQTSDSDLKNFKLQGVSLQDFRLRYFTPREVRIGMSMCRLGVDSASIFCADVCQKANVLHCYTMNVGGKSSFVSHHLLISRACDPKAKVAFRFNYCSMTDLSRLDLADWHAFNLWL